MPNEHKNYPENYVNLSLALSPIGKIHIDFNSDVQEQLPRDIAKAIQQQFSKSSAHGLLYLGIANFFDALPPSFAFWQRFSRLFIVHICHLSTVISTFDAHSIPMPKIEALQDIMQHAPLMIGVEYLNLEVLVNLWKELISTLNLELQCHDNNLQNYFNAYNSSWNLVGRVCFHLAENKNNPELPFAFLATYTDKLLATSGARHLPLGNALKEYAGEKNKALLLALLLPVQKAATQSSFINELLEKREIFHPLAWSPSEAHRFLHDIPAIEAAGVLVRVPNWWNPNKPSRPKVAVSIGQKEASAVGMNALLDFNMYIALSDGEKLTKAELQQLLNSSENLVKIKGQWVEIDHQKLTEVLNHWEKIQQQLDQEGLFFAAGLRLLAGVPTNNSIGEEKLTDAGSPAIL